MRDGSDRGSGRVTFCQVGSVRVQGELPVENYVWSYRAIAFPVLTLML